MKPIAVCTRCIFEDGLIEVTTTAHEGEHFPTLRRRFDAHIGSFTPRMLRCGDTAYGPIELRRAVTRCHNEGSEAVTQGFEYIDTKATEVCHMCRGRTIVDV